MPATRRTCTRNKNRRFAGVASQTGCSVLHEAVFAVAQSEQGAASEEEEDLVLPDEFPQEAAHTELVFRGEFVIRIDGAVGVGYGMVVDGLLADVEAEGVEGGARRGVVADDEREEALLQILVVEKDVDRICVVIHDGFVLIDGANIGVSIGICKFLGKILGDYGLYERLTQETIVA